VLDISDFSNYNNPNKNFLEEIKDKLLQYKYCFAWGSKAIKYKNDRNGPLEGINGDLVMLDLNFRGNRISSIVKYNKFSGIPYVRNIGTYHTTDIDLLQVFAKPLVKYVILKNKYKSLRIHEVATSLLGYGKLNNTSGTNISNMSVEERKAYCQYDAHLVAELVKLNNGDILKIMQIMANYTNLKLEEVCHKGMTGIWTKILNDAITKKVALVGYYNLPFALRKLYSSNQQSFSGCRKIENDLETELEEDDEDEEKFYSRKDSQEDGIWRYYTKSKRQQQQNETDARDSYKKYKGAIVLEPIRDLHHNVYLFDVTSLYPTMIIKYNLSPESINCSCCKNYPKATELVTPEIVKDYKYISNEGSYWICQRRMGLFAKLLQELTEQRIKYKNVGLEIESQAIKPIINSGYGVFGHPYFKYYDPRLAELVTAFGRDTLTKMRSIANALGFVTLYGDTDSLFVNNVGKIGDAQIFIEECKSQLGVDVGHEKTFSKLILAGKKHYIGVLTDTDKEPIIKGMEGIKSDRPEFIRGVFTQLVNDIKDDINPIPKLKQALQQLDSRSVSPDQLAMSLVLRKNPEEYTQICKQSILGGKLGLRKDDTLVYYKCDKQELVHDRMTNKDLLRRIHESENAADISYAKYRDMLVNSVKDVMDILGYDAEKDLLSKPQLVNSSYFERREQN
jgi:hypothetical protein